MHYMFMPSSSKLRSESNTGGDLSAPGKVMYIEQKVSHREKARKGRLKPLCQSPQCKSPGRRGELIVGVLRAYTATCMVCGRIKILELGGREKHHFRHRCRARAPGVLFGALSAREKTC